MANNNSIEVRPYASALGAEILGVDLAQPLDDRDWGVIRDAFHKHLVVFFRDQHMTPEQQVRFSERFGELEPYPFVHGIDGHAELIEIVKMPDEVQNFGGGWHVDMSFREQPPLGAVLYGIEVPPVGGDTIFANMHLAYDALSKGMNAIVKTLRGVHDSQEPGDHSEPYKGMRLTKKEGMKRQVTRHPMVRVHPVTGRESLFISPSYCLGIDDLDPEEGRLILDRLERHATRAEFTCRFRWQSNSVAVWDNRCLMHMALNDDLDARATGRGFKRVMRRATIRV
jgi:taurine dioxygenase